MAEYVERKTGEAKALFPLSAEIAERKKERDSQTEGRINKIEFLLFAKLSKFNFEAQHTDKGSSAGIVCPGILIRRNQRILQSTNVRVDFPFYIQFVVDS